MRTFLVALALPFLGQDARPVEKKLPVIFDHSRAGDVLRTASFSDFDIVVEVTWDRELRYRVNGAACPAAKLRDSLDAAARKHPFHEGVTDREGFGIEPVEFEEFDLTATGDRENVRWTTRKTKWERLEDYVAKADPGKADFGILRTQGPVSWQHGALALYASSLVAAARPLQFEIALSPRDAEATGRSVSKSTFQGSAPKLRRYERPKFADPVVQEAKGNYSSAVVLVSAGENVDAAAVLDVLATGTTARLIHYAIQVDAGSKETTVLPLGHIHFGITASFDAGDDAVVVRSLRKRKPRPLPEMEKPKDLDPNKKIHDGPPEDPIFFQDESVDELIRKLSSESFAEQGRAADALVRRGPEATAAIEKLAKSDDVDLRAWSDRILARIRKSDARMRALLEKLASMDDEVKETAEKEIRGLGRSALPWLREAAKSDNKNLRLRAGKLLDEIEDAEDFDTMKGDSLEFNTDKPFKGKGLNDAIGTGGGAGGRYGGRLGGKKNLVARGGGGADTEDTVLAALKWLARHQNPDGSWSVTKFDCGKCAPNLGEEAQQAGVTGLALLAFLGAGYSHLSKDKYDGIGFGDVVRKALQWFMSHQDPEGCIGGRDSEKYMYGHLVCALALTEAYGLTGSNLFKDQAQKAVDFTIAAQNPGKGWRYSYQCGDNDSSVTGWAVALLKSAEIAGLFFPKSGYDGARNWFDEVTEESYYRVGYTAKNTGKVYIPKQNEEFNHHEALTALGIMARIFMDKKKDDPRIVGGCQLLVRDLPKWEKNDIDFYYWYHATMALFQADGPSGALWQKWNQAVKGALTKNQNRDGCKAGSWEPVDRWSCVGGRVYATALNALTLEIYYRYATAEK